jgi:hypothetical protein
LDVRLPGLSGLDFQGVQLLGDEPALSESEVLYQRVLANDPVDAIEHAKSFMAEHSLSHYCGHVARPALALAHKDVERGLLESDKVETFKTTVGGSLR